MLEQKIEALTAAVEALTAAIKANPSHAAVRAEEVKVQISDVSEPAPAPAPTGPTEQDVKDLTLSKSREGHKDAIRDKLAGFGAKKIGDLKGAQSTEFYNWLQTLGSN
jgi:hypothetical protein